MAPGFAKHVKKEGYVYDDYIYLIAAGNMVTASCLRLLSFPAKLDKVISIVYTM